MGAAGLESFVTIEVDMLLLCIVDAVVGRSVNGCTGLPLGMLLGMLLGIPLDMLPLGMIGDGACAEGPRRDIGAGPGNTGTPLAADEKVSKSESTIVTKHSSTS